MKTSRRKGHEFERRCAQEFRELGFTDCMTKREARGGDWSNTDDGQDLVNCEPFAVQCKRLQQYASVNTIEEIRTNNPNAIAPFTDLTIPLLLTKANNKETMAVLPWEELKKLIRKCYGPDITEKDMMELPSAKKAHRLLYG